MSVRTAVFASGGGSNLQALFDRLQGGNAAQVCLVVSDRADAPALRRATDAGVPTMHIPVRDRAADAVARDTLAVLGDHDIELVLLAGYLRLVPAAVTSEFRDRMLNIHPALLPAFGGPGMYGVHVHEAVIAAGCRITGATVHWVDERYDHGRILAQWPVPVLPGDSAASLAERVLRIEHRLYPAAVTAVARRMAAARADAGAAITAGADVFRLLQDADRVDDDMIALTGL